MKHLQPRNFQMLKKMFVQMKKKHIQVGATDVEVSPLSLFVNVLQKGTSVEYAGGEIISQNFAK